MALAESFAMCEIQDMKRKFTPPKEPKDFARLLVSEVVVSPGYASDLARGNRIPSLTKAVEFERTYGIPCAFWVERAI